MTKRVLQKQVSEKMKIYFMGVLFIVLTIGIINACNIWQGEEVKKDFYNHIPAIQVYQRNNGLLGDNILISLRIQLIFDYYDKYAQLILFRQKFVKKSMCRKCTFFNLSE